MPELITLIPVFLIGLIANIFGTLVGGGSLLSIPFLILIGLPPQVAIASERFGGLGQTVAAFIKFFKSREFRLNE